MRNTRKRHATRNIYIGTGFQVLEALSRSTHAADIEDFYSLCIEIDHLKLHSEGSIFPLRVHQGAATTNSLTNLLPLIAQLQSWVQQSHLCETR